MARRVDITIFGVTGYTGTLMLRYREKYPQYFAGRTVAIAGRSRAKLGALAKQFPGEGELEIVIADVDDPESITRMVGQTRVLITCVGPYAKWGEPCVRACAEAGTHYVDITGEGAWIHEMARKYHDVAMKSGATIIPACGFDSVPADLLAHYAFEQVPAGERAGLHVGLATAVTMGLRADPAKSPGGVSHGTYQTLLHSMASGEGLQPVEEYKPSAPRLTNGVHVDPVLNEALSPLEITSDPYVVRRTHALLPEAERAGAFEYTHNVNVQVRAAGYAMRFGLLFFWLLCKIPPVLWFLQRRMTVAQGPDDAGRENARMKLRCAVRSFQRQRAAGAARVHGVACMDVLTDGYNVTAMTAMQVALMLVEQHGRLRLPGGILTPVSALGAPLLDRCTRDGMLAVRMEAKL